MDCWTRLSRSALVVVLAQGTVATPVWAQAVTPAPVAEPLVADWVWVAALVVAILGALWYFLRTRRG